MSAAGVVAALEVEALTLGPAVARSGAVWTVRDGTLVAQSGMGVSAAESAAHALVEAGATALVSWGLAGGLDPVLAAGTVCLPNLILVRDGPSFATDSSWRELLAAAIGGTCSVVGGSLFTCAAAIGDIAGKAAAFRETGAAAVDMESVGVARAAAAHALPFIAVRVIVDTAGDSLPAAVLAASSGGRVRVARLIRGIVRAPGELVPLFRLMRRYRAAKRALSLVARAGSLAPPALAAAPAARSA